MNLSYSIKREPAGLALPFGAGGVAAIGAAALCLVGLLVPIAWLETISFQLYLDLLTPAAAPPLGTTARIIAALALALFGGVLGYALAKAFGVVPSDHGLADLVARFRGARAEDEADAPDLRAVDRHPDAPARRPFSAARDIEAVEEDGRWRPLSTHGDEEDGELLLDAAFVPAEEETAAQDAPIAAAGPRDAEPLSSFIPIEAYDLAPPSPDDWERDAAVEAAPTIVPDPAEPAPRPRAAPAPLDLSAARLDELIARLESGLTRRAAGAPAPAEAEAPLAVDAGDPAFPHDPALAAALSTLRKMNLRAV